MFKTEYTDDDYDENNIVDCGMIIKDELENIEWVLWDHPQLYIRDVNWAIFQNFEYGSMMFYIPTITISGVLHTMIYFWQI